MATARAEMSARRVCEECGRAVRFRYVVAVDGARHERALCPSCGTVFRWLVVDARGQLLGRASPERVTLAPALLDGLTALLRADPLPLGTFRSRVRRRARRR